MGSVAVAMVNFDPSEPAAFAFEEALGAHQDFVLSPGPDPVVPGAPWSSRGVLLNGQPLHMSGPEWALPAALTGEGRHNSGSVVLPPLHIGFAVFPGAGAADCSK